MGALTSVSLSIVMGGIGGAAAIVVAVIAELDWDCWYRGFGCHDGQGGIVLMVLVPRMFVVGAVLGACWARVTSQLPPSSLLSANYGGTQKIKSQILGWLTPVGMCSSGCLVVFLLLVLLGR